MPDQPRGVFQGRAETFSGSVLEQPAKIKSAAEQNRISKLKNEYDRDFILV